MSQVQNIALWVGLIASVAGIVLSVVAITFSILVNRRSQEVSDQTIQSLQKIESTVGQLSEDTRELIKAGWDKMLGTVGDTAEDEAASEAAAADAEELAEGIAAELRAQLGMIAGADGERPVERQTVEEIEEILQGLESSLASQIEYLRDVESPSQALDRLLERVNGLSLSAQALLTNIRFRHLEMDEYREVASGPFGDALMELRQSGLIVPLVHTLEGGEEVPCYYYPKGISKLMSAAIPLMDDVPGELQEQVREELLRAGYPREALNGLDEHAPVD